MRNIPMTRNDDAGHSKGAVGCDLNRPDFTCSAVCSSKGGATVDIEASTVALGKLKNKQPPQHFIFWFNTRDDPDMGLVGW